MSNKNINPPPLKKLQLLKLKLQSLKSKIKLPKVKIANILSLSLSTLMLTGVMLYATVKGPQLHGAFLRSYVGSKVYKIKGSPHPNSGGGTGFAVKGFTGQSYILTNAHVCEGALQESRFPGHVLVVYDKGIMPRRVIEISNQSDLCILEGLPGVEGLSLGDKPEVGEVIAVVGHPLLRPLTLARGEVIGHEDVVLTAYPMKTGNQNLDAMIGAQDGQCDDPKNIIDEQELMIISGAGIEVHRIKVCMINIRNSQMLDAVIHPGNSGSPMVDFFGNVVGVVFAQETESKYGYGVSYDDVTRLLSRY